jgi:hypothetical protein
MSIDAEQAWESLSAAFNVREDDHVRTDLDVLRLAERHVAIDIRERTMVRGLYPSELP